MSLDPMPVADLKIIEEEGIPAFPGAVYATVHADRSFTFTPRGRRLYRVSMLMHGLNPDPVDAARTLEELRELAQRIALVRFIRAYDAAEAALNNGRIPVKALEAVNAFLYGSVDDFHAAVERRLMCEQAGENVIPASFGKRSMLL